MKYFKFSLSLLLALGVFYALNTKLGSVPPLGKFLSPSQGVWQNEKTESTSDNFQIEGLLDKVTVYYDANLIPHIFAQNDMDLYRSQGYITAKHRLWQMEFQTYASGGRLSEIIGEKALNYDRAQRRKGMVFGAENALEKMKEDPEILQFQTALDTVFQKETTKKKAARGGRPEILAAQDIQGLGSATRRQRTIIGGLQGEARFKDAADFAARQANIGQLLVRKLVQRLVGIALGGPGGDGGQDRANTGADHGEDMAEGLGARGMARSGCVLVDSLNRRGAGREAGFEIGEMRVHV